MEKDDLLKNEMLAIKKKLVESLENYRKTLSYMYADAPIACLCLSNVVEKILINKGCLRIYDLFDRDFTEIEGMTNARIRELTARLDEFISVS